MPRRLRRKNNTGHLHFITSSCFQRRPLLATNPRRDRCLELLEQVRRRYKFLVAGYVVMPEHIHLLISEPERGTISTVMQVLKQGSPRRVLRHARRRNQQQLNLWESVATKLTCGRNASTILWSCVRPRKLRSYATCTAIRSGGDWSCAPSNGLGAASATMPRENLAWSLSTASHAQR